MRSEKLSYKYIFPNEFGDFKPEAVLFFFSKQKNETEKVLNKITDCIQEIEPTMLHRIESHINLELITTSRDMGGNVCFAGDRDLRPEYRINFYALDLWDYYYAIWHSSFFWNDDMVKEKKLPLPHPDKFWSIVEIGSLLRELHSSTDEPEKVPLKLSGTGKCEVCEIKSRFRKAHPGKNTGHLYLNQAKYVKGIPVHVWEFNLAGVELGKKWIEDHIGHAVTSDDLEELSTIIWMVDRTIPIQRAIDKLLEK